MGADLVRDTLQLPAGQPSPATLRTMDEAAQPLSDRVDASPWRLSFRLRAAARAPERLLVLLHGADGDEQQFGPVAARIDAHTLVVLPRGHRTLGGERIGWYRVALGGEQPRTVVEEAEEATQRVAEFVGQLQARHGLPGERTVLAGFSQGGALAAAVALTSPGLLAGFAVLGGRIVPELAPGFARSTQLHGLEALLVHNAEDPTLPVELARDADASLEQLGVRHRLQLCHGGHRLVPAMQAQFVDWFADRRRGWWGGAGKC